MLTAKHNLLLGAWSTEDLRGEGAASPEKAFSPVCPASWAALAATRMFFWAFSFPWVPPAAKQGLSGPSGAFPGWRTTAEAGAEGLSQPGLHRSPA